MQHGSLRIFFVPKHWMKFQFIHPQQGAIYRQGGQNQRFSTTVFSGLQVAPEYKPHPLFLPKIWEKFVDKSHLIISRTLFCYFLAHTNVLGCIHVMRRAARRDRRGPENSTRGLNSVGESLRWCSNLMPSHEVRQLCDVCGSKSGVTH